MADGDCGGGQRGRGVEDLVSTATAAGMHVWPWLLSASQWNPLVGLPK